MATPIETKFIPGLSDPRLTRYYDPVLKWIFWEEFFRRPLVDAVQAAPGHVVVDVGCGTGTLTIALARTYPDATVVGLDIDGAMLSQAKAKAAEVEQRPILAQGSAVTLPCATGSVNAVVASMMVHHLATDQKLALFAEAHRVLSPAGVFFLLDFNAPETEWQAAIARRFAHFERIDDNLYGRLPTLLHTAGFGIVNVHWRAFNGLLTLYRAAGSAQ